MTLLETLMGGASALAFFPILGGLGVSQNQGYQIARSVRMKGSTSKFQYTLTGASTDTTKGTYNGWIKRCGLGTVQEVVYIGNNTGNANYLLVRWTISDQLEIYSGANLITSTRVFRDPSAWLNLNIKWDLSQGTAANRVIVEVNGEVVTMTGTYPTISNFDAGNTNIQYLGKSFNGVSDCYYSEQRWIDGQYLAATNFGQFDAVTGVWFPKTYAGTYGNNGFYLNFADNSNNTAATIGKDLSGNAHNFTPTNISVTAGVTNDSLVDTPTNYGSDTGLGGEVQGNYATLNPLDAGLAPTEGNLRFSQPSSSHVVVRTTTAIPETGLYYAESKVLTTTSGAAAGGFGLCNTSLPLTGAPTSNANSWMTYSSSSMFVYNQTTTIGTYTSLVANDIIKIAIDKANGRAWMGVNTVWFDGAGGTTGNPSTGTNPTFTSLPANLFLFSNAYANTFYVNTGQRPWEQTCPTNFKALCTQNFPTPAVIKPSTVMDAKVYVGNGTSQSITADFQPDLVWMKNRSATFNNTLIDSSRGITKRLFSDSTAVEDTDATTITAFNTNGFSVGSSGVSNGSGNNQVAWAWKKGAIPGFDVVAVASASAAAVNHALGVKPSFIVIKNRNTAGQTWVSTHKSALPNMQDGFIGLNTTSAYTSSAGLWGGEPTSTTFFAGSGAMTTAASYIAYLWAEVPGYSKFGSYTGNGNADGTFVNLGFRPRYILIKRIDSAEDWEIYDSSRDPYNVGGKFLAAQSTAAETSLTLFDFVSNGIKLRNSGSASNVSGATYIYAAFAEAPFKYARAR